MRSPRVYIVIAGFHPFVGGAETQTLAQSQNLHKRGYEATVVTFRHRHAWAAREEVGGVPVIRVAGFLLGGRNKLPRLLQRLLYMMALLVMAWTLWQQRHNYDVLHVCQLNMLALPTALVARLTGKPIIFVVLSTESGKATAAGPHKKASLIAGPLDATLAWLQVDAPMSAGGDLEGLERTGKPVVQLTRALLYRVGAVVVVLSSRMSSYLVRHNFDLPGMQLISNGVDITRFHPIQTGNSSGERGGVVVCVSKLRYEKGVDVLLQAWRLVHQEAPQARLIIVGNGTLQSQLERMAKALDIAESVEFTGLQSDVPAQLHRGSIAVLPSRWEGMPNAVLEAMACGLPCVATRVSGSEDIVEHGINGLLVEPEDYQGMAQALLTLLHDPLLVERYGLAARETIQKRYSLEQIIDRYVELYQSITRPPCQDPEDSVSSEIWQRLS